MSIASQLRILAASTLFALAVSAVPAYAQSAGAPLTVRIPFAFETGSQHLPAGTYVLGEQYGTHMLQISSSGQGGFTMVQPEISLKPAGKSKVVFRRYGNRYFLREVWSQGDTIHLDCVRSKAEKQLQVARLDAAPTDIEVAAVELPR